ncbi:MAG: TIGR01777 family protein [Ignavibacteriae bacterium]|nr:TIGR01777 family protein [Ignavibacteriota bacterium]
MAHIIMTGATGLLGKRIYAALRARGDSVTVFSRHPERAAGVFPDAARVLLWSPGMPGAWREAFDGADAVLHLAGESVGASRWNAEVKRRIRESRVEGTRAIAEAIGAAARPPRLLLSMSGVGYYGDTGDNRAAETAAPGDDFFSQVCAAWESAALAARGAHTRVAIARAGVVLAREGGALPRLRTPFMFFAGGPFGHGRQWFPWVHIDDAVAALLHALDTVEVAGPFNLVAPDEVRNAEFMNALGAALSRPAFLRVPAFALRLAAGEFASALLTGQRLAPETLLATGFQFRFPQLPHALQDLLNESFLARKR